MQRDVNPKPNLIQGKIYGEEKRKGKKGGLSTGAEQVFK